MRLSEEAKSAAERQLAEHVRRSDREQRESKAKVEQLTGSAIAAVRSLRQHWFPRQMASQGRDFENKLATLRAQIDEAQNKISLLEKEARSLCLLASLKLLW